MLTYDFTDQFDVQTGLRFGHNSQKYQVTSIGVLNSGNDFFDSSSQNMTTYMITPRYKVLKDLMLYGILSTGYRPDGPNAASIATIPRIYGADTTCNLAKEQYFDRKLMVDIALFKIDWKNIQVLLHDPVRSFGYYANVGGAKSHGLELLAVWYPMQGWSISGNTALTHSVLTASTGNISNGKPEDRLPYVAKVRRPFAQP